MLRRSVARAFAPPDAVRPSRVDPRPPRNRAQAVARLFGDIHAEFARRLPAPTGESVAAGTDADHDASEPGGRVSAVRAYLAGVEFLLETDVASYRFLNTLDWGIQVHRSRAGRWLPDAILSVHVRDGEFVPIRKQIRDVRSGFEYTSIRALAARYLGDEPGSRPSSGGNLPEKPTPGARYLIH